MRKLSVDCYFTIIDPIAPIRLMISAMIPIIDPAPNSTPFPTRLLVVPEIPTATPIIPQAKQTNARPFPPMSMIDLMLSPIMIVRMKQTTEMAEIIHAKVIKARPAVILAQEELP